RKFALFAAAFVALGSPLWSVSADALWTHGATHALLAGMLLAIATQRMGAAAVFGGLSILFRPHLVVPVLVIGAFQKDWRSRLAISAGALFGVAVLAGYSMWIFGQPLPAAGYPVGQVVQGMPLQSPSAFAANVVDWLFDPKRGVLIMVPAVLLAIPKLRPAWTAAPGWVRVGAVAGVAYAFAQIGLIRASGGNYFFGHRTTIEALVLASPLMVLSINEWTRELRSPGRVLLLVVLGYSLLVHAYGAMVGVPPGLKEVLMEEQQEVRDMLQDGAPGR
ncbi:MAG TPA: hypothetical protein VJ925_07400, partial [Longimicrobiales bacterium]|nr:hypothetical protein [Longimicrobiales bacterium]